MKQSNRGWCTPSLRSSNHQIEHDGDMVAPSIDGAPDLTRALFDHPLAHIESVNSPSDTLPSRLPHIAKVRVGPNLLGVLRAPNVDKGRSTTVGRWGNLGEIARDFDERAASRFIIVRLPVANVCSA